MVKIKNSNDFPKINLVISNNMKELKDSQDSEYENFSFKGAGTIYDSSGSSYTGLFDAEGVSTGSDYLAYCIDHSTTFVANKTYHDADAVEVSKLFPANAVKCLRQMLNFTQPLYTDMDYLAQICGADNLTKDEAIMATQAAIWSIVNPPYALDTSGKNQEGVVKFYKYLLTQSMPGWDESDLAEQMKIIEVNIECNKRKQAVNGDQYLFGPYEVTSSSILCKDTFFQVFANDSNANSLIITDAEGNAISEARVGTKLYVAIPKKPCIDSFTVGLSGLTEYGVDIKVIISEGGVKASQSLMIIVPLLKDIDSVCKTELRSIEVEKTDADNDYKQLSGAEFELYSDSLLLDTQTTNQVGKAMFCNLLDGKYTIKETKSPDGYVIVGDGIYDAETCCRHTTIAIKNICVTGKIIIYKYDKSDNDIGVSGAEFDIINDKNELVDHVVTNQQGYAESKPLPLGGYSLVETKAPEGYYPDTTAIHVKLADDGQEIVIKKVYICNKKIREPKKGRFTIRKIGICCSGVVLSGVTFTVYDMKGNVVDVIETGKDGCATTKELPFGTYRSVETLPPEGYNPLLEPIFVTIQSESTNDTIKVQNKPIPYKENGWFRVNKYDKECDKIKLGGALLFIYNENGDKISEIDTKINEFAISEKLPFGRYKMVEEVAPQGYKLDKTPYYFDIDSETLIKTLNIENERLENPETTMIQINKFDLHCPEYKLQGAKFEVYNMQGNLVDTLETDFYGRAESIFLPLGDYAIYEVAAPIGFLLDEYPFFIKLAISDKVYVLNIPNKKDYE